MKSIDVKDNTYKESSDKDPKFQVGDHVRILRYKNSFTQGYIPNWSEEVFAIKKVKILFHGDMLLIISMLKKLLQHFMKRTGKNKPKRIQNRKSD